MSEEKKDDKKMLLSREDNFKEINQIIKETELFLGAKVLSLTALAEYMRDVPDSRDVTTMKTVVEYKATIGLKKPDPFIESMKWVMLIVIIGGAIVLGYRMLPDNQLSPEQIQKIANDAVNVGVANAQIAAANASRMKI